MTWIKICATTNLEDALLAIDAGADALGFVLAPSRRRIDPLGAAEIISALPVAVEKIGVFVNESPEHVAEIAGRTALTGVQLHGDESPEQMAAFRRALGGRKIIKTLQARELLGPNGAQFLAAYLRMRDIIDAVLVDSGGSARRGGTGATFDWELAAPLAAKIKKVLPVIIAGGLTPENVGKAIRMFEPWGVDVVSGVERETGSKDEVKLRKFVASVAAAKKEALATSMTGQQ